MKNGIKTRIKGYLRGMVETNASHGSVANTKKI